MKILVLIHEFPPVGGGGGRVAQDIATGLSSRGHDIRVITPHIENLPSTSHLAGIQVERIPSSRKSAYRAYLKDMAHYNFSAVKTGMKMFRSWKPDVIHAHFAVPAGAAAFTLSKMAGIPYLLTAHLGDIPGAVPEKTDNWFKWIYPLTPTIWKSAARVVAVSEFTRNMAQRYYSVPIEVIPNGVELSALPLRENKKAEDSIRIVFAGRFMEQKNPEHLIQALIHLKDLPWTCAMLGDGPLLSNIREQVKQYGLADRFWMPGWVTPEHVLAEFARSDILVLPSRSEGLSVVGVQALGMGLAMILSDAGGNLELVDHGENGFLFPVGDVNKLTTYLKNYLQNPSMLKSAQLKSYEMAKKYNLATIISQYENIFTELNKKE